MTFPEVFKAFLEIGILGLCAVMMCIIFYENHKRSHQTDDEKNKLLTDNFKGLNEKMDTMDAEIAATSYDYKWALVMLACLGVAAFILGIILKIVDKKKHLGLEEPNIKPE